MIATSLGRGSMVALAALVTWLGACARPLPVPTPPPPVPVAEATARVFLIGDAGAPHEGFEPVLAALAADIARGPEASWVVFLGDNLYPRGLPAESAAGRPEAERRLRDQVAAVRDAGGRAIFVPGNHDWDRQGPDGWDAVRRAEAFIVAQGGGRAVQLPAGGCPGPAVRDVPGVRLVLIDTQWWLHGGPRPEDPSPCVADTDAEFLDSVRTVVAGAGGRAVIVTAHHPLISGGVHGGSFGILDHVFPLRALHPALWLPLPVIGSLYPIARQSGISNQDLSGGRNRALRDSLTAAFGTHRPLVYAAGHDHDLQVHDGTEAGVGYALVSGTGIYGHDSRVSRRPTTLFASREAGYMRLDVIGTGRVRLSVVGVDAEGRGRELYGAWLE